MRYKAMELWAGGMGIPQVGAALEVKAATVKSWRERGQPLSWTKFRDDVRAEAEDQIRARLLKKRVEVLETHYKDADRLRLLVMARTVKPKHDADGKVIGHVANTDLLPRDIRDLTAALGNIVTMQRLSLGIPTDYTITGAAIAEVDDLAGLGLGADAIKRLGDALADEISASVPLDFGAIEIDAEVAELADGD